MYKTTRFMVSWSFTKLSHLHVLRFIIVGGISTTINLVVIYTLFNVLELHYVVSSIPVFVLGTLF